MSLMKYSLVFVLGAAATAGVLQVMNPSALKWNAHNETSEESSEGKSSAKEPLYWVAPMDPNYRRDKPGKSPMGMDLIPFYGDDAKQDAPGTVAITPEVINNLGVRIGEAKQGVLAQSVGTVGYVKYNADRLSHVHARVSGWIEKSYVKTDGDPVKKGEPLFDLYSPELVNAQEELIFALNRKDERLVQAAQERLKALQVPNGFLQQLQSSRKVSQTVRFFAQHDGVVDSLGIRDGFYVTPGMTLMSIANLTELWLEADVFEQQVHMVKVGQSIQAKIDAIPGRSFNGKVDFIYPTIDEKTRTTRVRVRLPNQELLLKPNMFAHLTIAANSHDSTLLIPKQALIRGAQQNRVVLALGEGKFKSIAVKVGRFGDDEVEVLEGLKAGDAIVTSAQFLLDSESSKTSDFLRMSSPDAGSGAESGAMDHSAHTANATISEKVNAEPVSNVWVEARINRLDAPARKINVDHAAIEEWKWPKMTMDFSLAEWVEVSELPIGKPIQLEITKESSTRYIVTDFFDASAN